MVGVVSTEATANAHSYVVTALLGPAAFAPIAAATLLFRPIPLVILSLTQLERPRISQLLRDRRVEAAWRALQPFRWVAFAVWTGNVVLALVVVGFFLELVVRGDYDPQTITVATLFWCLIMGLRCLRGPESALVQANGDFGPLSKVTVVSCLVTLPAVLLLVHLWGAVWSLAGIAGGEVVAALLTTRLARKLVRPQTAVLPAQSAVVP